MLNFNANILSHRSIGCIAMFVLLLFVVLVVVVVFTIWQANKLKEILIFTWNIK